MLGSRAYRQQRMNVTISKQVSEMHDYGLLRGVALFADASDELLETIADRCAWRSYKIGEEIVGYQDDSSDVYFVLSGSCGVKIYSTCGRIVGFRKLLPGDTFGEFAAMDRLPRSASIEAERESRLAVMESEHFRQIVFNQRAVSEALILHLISQLRALTVRVLEYSTLAVNDRIDAELFRLICDGVGEPTADGKGFIISPAPTRPELAARISTHREAISRHLTELSRIGLIRRKGRDLIVTDVLRLKSMVEEASGS